MIKNEPGFAAIKAVRDNQIFIIDEMIVSRPTLRLLNGIYKIGSKVYPEIFTEEVRRRVIMAIE
jgi:iron complex transport system substrate-binding protein